MAPKTFLGGIRGKRALIVKREPLDTVEESSSIPGSLKSILNDSDSEHGDKHSRVEGSKHKTKKDKGKGRKHIATASTDQGTKVNQANGAGIVPKRKRVVAQDISPTPTQGDVQEHSGSKQGNREDTINGENDNKDTPGGKRPRQGQTEGESIGLGSAAEKKLLQKRVLENASDKNQRVTVRPIIPSELEPVLTQKQVDNEESGSHQAVDYQREVVVVEVSRARNDGTQNSNLNQFPNKGLLWRPSNASGVTRSKRSSGFVSRGKAQKPKARNNTRSYQSVRFLVRRGLVPIASLDDSHWFSKLQDYITLFNSKTSIRSFGDTFEELHVGKGPIRCLPKHNGDVIDAELTGKFENSLVASQKELATIVRVAMHNTACILIGKDASRHERIFAQRFDMIEWVSRCEYRLMMFNLTKLLKLVFPDESDWEKANIIGWDFTERAMVAVDIFVMIYSGMVSLFQILWNRTTNCSFRSVVGKYLYQEIYDKIFNSKAFGGQLPCWSRAWIRVLLFSLPPDPEIPEDEEDKVLYDIGANYEHLCLLQLYGVMEVRDPKVLEALREPWHEQSQRNNAMEAIGEPSDLCIASRRDAKGKLSNIDRRDGRPFEKDAVDVMDCSNRGGTNQGPEDAANLRDCDGNKVYTGKKEPYPWNKVLRWNELLEPIQKIVEGRSQAVSRHKEQTEIIKQSRNLLVRNISKVHIKEVCRESRDDEERLDKLIDIIMKRGIENQVIPQSANGPRFGDKTVVLQASDGCLASTAMCNITADDWRLPE